MTEEPISSDVTHPEDEDQKAKGIVVLFRFVLVPLIVVGAVVFVIVLFGNMALKEKSVKDYLYDIRTGSQSERWQAAYHLSNMLANPNKDYAEEARKHLPEIISIFEKAKGEDPEIRRYLALTLGRLQDPRAVPALQGALDDDDSQTVIWSIWSLGNIGDKQATPMVLQKLESSDQAIRSMSAYVLGALQDKQAIPPLQAHLDDPAAEVRWNAALALSRMGDASGKQVLLNMLDRKYLNGFQQMDEQNKEELMVNAIHSAAKLNDSELRAQIEHLSKSDPNPRVRNTAIKELQ